MWNNDCALRAGTGCGQDFPVFRIRFSPPVLALLARAILAQAPATEVPVVEPGRPVELWLAGGESRTVRIPAASGEYLRITATPDSELVVKTSLYDPAGQLVAVTPSLGGSGGRSVIAALAAAAGDFRLTVTSRMFLPERRSCAIGLTLRRPATDEDRVDGEGHREFARAAAQAANGATGMRAAIAALDRPIELARRAHDDLLEMRAIFGKGQFLATLEDLEAAVPYFQESLALCRQAGEKRAAAHALDDLGLVYARLEHYADAIEQYHQALELQTETGQHWETALTLSNLADAEAALGRVDQSLQALERQEEIRNQLGDEFGLNETWLGMADAYLALGDQQRALDLLIRTLPRWPRFRNQEDGRESETAAYRRLGLVYMALGDYDSAAASLSKAMRLARALSNKRILAETLVVEARLAALSGDRARALQFGQKALAASRAAGYRRGEALALLELAKLRMVGGGARAAISLAARALHITMQLAQPYDEASARRTLGMARAALGETAAADREYTAALALARRIGDRFGEVQTLLEHARLKERLGRPRQALGMLDDAIAVIDRTRSAVAAPELRASYLASQRAVYELSADILARLDRLDPGHGYGSRAFDISEQAHARTLLDALGQTEGGHHDSRNRELLAHLNGVEAALRHLASSEPLRTRRAEERIRDLLETRNELESRLRATGDSGQGAGAVAPLPLEGIRRQLLGNGTVLLEYLTGARHSHLWVVSDRGLHHYDLPREAVLRDATRRLYDALTAANRLKPNLQPSERQALVAAADESAAREAAALERILLPMPPAVLGNGPLFIVPDGPVQMAPFAFLPAPGHPNRRLGSRCALAFEPSASVLARIRQRPRLPRDGRILIVADPVYSPSDPRAGGSHSDPGVALLRAGDPSRTDAGATAAAPSSRLRMSRAEAESIRRLAPGRTLALVDFDAVPAALARASQDTHSIIHIAAHTVLDERHPELSGLMLSVVDRRAHRQDGFVRVLDIYRMRLDAGLVVLSACETSLGRDLRGEGFLGLARAFLYAGARQVVASLWNVDDRATAAFMQRFYVALLRDRLNAAAALRRAQAEMREDPAWRSPVFWAGFVLEGDLAQAAVARQ